MVRLTRWWMGFLLCICTVLVSCGGGGAAAVVMAILTGSSLPTGTIGIVYPAATLQAGGGTSPYSWILLGGNAPGLSLSSAGVLSGTPSAAGVFGLHVRATDARDHSAEKDLSLTVNGVLRLAVAGQGNVASNPTGISCPADCEEAFFPGSIVSLWPSPVAGWRFDGWTGDADCSDNQVTVNSVKSCTATFVPLPTVLFTLTVSKTGNGRVASSPPGVDCGADCTEDYVGGTQVTLIATPDAGWQFAGWSGSTGCLSGILDMLENKTCTANFTQIGPPSQPVIYVTVVSHNEEAGAGRPDYVADPNYYLQNRNLVKLLAETITSKGGKYNSQSDWNYLKAVALYDTGSVTNDTNGKNIVRWMKEDLGVEIDPHAHETQYNYADVAYLIGQLGVAPSKNVGGFLYDPPDNAQGWEKHINGLWGAIYPNYFWQADDLWGAATYLHQGNDDRSSGVWRPRDRYNFTTDDPNQRLVYIGGCLSNQQGVQQLLDDISSGRAPADGFYTATIMMIQDFMDAQSIAQLGQFIDSLSPEVAAGKVQWATLTEMAQIWRTEYGAKPFRYDCAAVAPTTYTTETIETWVTAPDGNQLYTRVIQPVPSLYPGQRFPALVAITGGTGPGAPMADNPGYQNLAASGFVVVVFNPEGRGSGQPGNLLSQGTENCNGYVHQDDLKAIAEYTASKTNVNASNIGVETASFGIAIGAGALGRYPTLPVKYLVDQEGPHDSRVITFYDVGSERAVCGHWSTMTDPSAANLAFWAEREAVQHIGSYPGMYLRMQAEVDHAQGAGYFRHTIEMVNAATPPGLGGTGSACWTRVNGADIGNPINTVYPFSDPSRYPSWVTGKLADHPGLNLDYDREMSGLSCAGGGGDTQPPTATVTLPTSGQVLSGTVTLSATATDNAGGVASVEFYMDSDTTAACADATGKPSGSTFSCSWNSIAKANGSHTVRAKAYDPSSNSGFSSSVTFNIQNGGGTPSPIAVHALVTGSSFPDIVKLTRIVVDDARQRAYFAGSLSRYIGVIDTQTLQMTGVIDSGFDGFLSRMLCLNPGNGVLYMFVIEQNKLYRIDPVSGSVSAPISVGRAPAFDTNTNRLYVSEPPDKVRIYSDTLQAVDVITGVTAPGELFIDPVQGKLYVANAVPPPQSGVSVYNLSTKAFVRQYSMPAGFDGIPKGILVGGGKIHVNGNTIKHSLSIIDEVSGSGTYIPLSEDGLQMEIYGGKLYQMIGYPYYAGYLPNADGSYGVLEIRDAITGAKLTDLPADLETLYFDIDQSTGRLFYSSTGRGVIGVINLADYSTIKKIDVATTMEDVVIHPADGSLYLRNRLGGSTVYRIDPQTGTLMNTLIPGNWPTKILPDSGRNRLYALSHYEAKVSEFDLSTDAKLLDIPLGIQRARTDALSTMAMNHATGKLYAIMPKLGTLTMVNADGSGSPLTVSIAGFTPNPQGGGPGKLHIAVNESLNRVYVFMTEAKRLNIYDGGTLALLTYSTISAYNLTAPPLDLLFSDDAGGRLFVGPHIVNPQTGAVTGQIPSGLKVIGMSPSRDRFYVMDFVTAGFYERVLEYDTPLQTVLRQWDLSPIPNGVYSAFGLDFSRGNMYVGYIDRGILEVINLSP